MTKTASTSRTANYPKSIFLIMATEFCERFSFCGLRTILSLYLRNILLFGENKATVIYHVFIMLCYCVPILGAVLADSFLGRFRTILYFGVIYTCGNVLLCLSAMPPFVTQAISVSIFGLILIATGTGGIKPCVAAFGGDQFRLPQQQQLLEQFFSIYYFTINFGGLMGMVITPLLRNAARCYNNDSCYALGFGFPAVLMILSLFLFVYGKQWYKIKSPKENVILRFINCSAYALIQKINSKNVQKEHWLDYALDKYDIKLINDMKTVLAILFLYIPLPLFWSLNDQQGSRWTFQASRTNGHILGVRILPDQVQVINPAIVLLLIPFMEKTLNPFLDRNKILTSPLQRMVTGGFIAALSFVASGILELRLQETYPLLPNANESHVNIVNLLPCTVQVVNPFNSIQPLKGGTNFVFKRVPAFNFSYYTIDILSPYECGKLFLKTPSRRITFKTYEYQVNTIFIYEIESNIEISNGISENLQKALSGKPTLRMVTIRDKNVTGVINVQLRNYRGFVKSELFIESNISTSENTELESGIYQYSVSFLGRKDSHHNGTLQLDCGGVYSFIIQEHENKIIFTKLFMMTPPNSIHVLWLFPQYFLISIGEAIFAIAGLQFSFTQAPKSMKTVTLAAWFLSIALGNLFVIIITQLHLFKSQASEFFFFAFLVFADMIVFMILTINYKFVVTDSDSTSSGSGAYSCTDESPLIFKLSSDSFENDST